MLVAGNDIEHGDGPGGSFPLLCDCGILNLHFKQLRWVDLKIIISLKAGP
jgi:hypothetical protein